MVNSSKACVVYGMRRVESSGVGNVSDSSTKIVGAAHLCEITQDELKTRVRVPASLLRSDGSVESDVMVVMPVIEGSTGSLSRVIRGALHVNWPASPLFVLIHRWWCDDEFCGFLYDENDTRQR